MLIPEISLTYQTLARFRKHFGTRVAFVNSKQSKGEKYEQFRKAKEGEVDVVIGPRSALFTPFPNLKLLVMDEEHDPAFKSDQAPRYHARDVAIKRAELEEASVILGSATPSIESYARAEAGQYRLWELKRTPRMVCRHRKSRLWICARSSDGETGVSSAGVSMRRYRSGLKEKSR